MNKSLKLPKFSDGSVASFETTNIPTQRIAQGATASGTPGLATRKLMMWRREDHYFKRVQGKEDRDLGTFYITSWQTYGPRFPGRTTALEALDYYEKRGWQLMETSGPPANPKCLPVETFDDNVMGWVTNWVYVGERMKALPKDWQAVNAKVIEEMDKSEVDKNVELMRQMAKADLAEVIAALKAGKL